MIFAAGLGSRLQPITDTMPKALVPVKGEPLLKRVLLKLKKQGFTQIVVNIHHFAPLIIDYLHDNDNFGMDIRLSYETGQRLETGGGIKKARELFSPDSNILIHNVDILSNVKLDEFYDKATENTDALLLVSRRHTTRYLLFNDDMRLVGWTNISTGEVKSPYKEVRETPIYKLSSKYKKYAFSGIHVFSPHLFNYMDRYPEKFGIIDFYIENCDKADIRGYVKYDLNMIDVGKIDTLIEAENFVESSE